MGIDYFRGPNDVNMRSFLSNLTRPEAVLKLITTDWCVFVLTVASMKPSYRYFVVIIIILYVKSASSTYFELSGAVFSLLTFKTEMKITILFLLNSNL